MASGSISVSRPPHGDQGQDSERLPSEGRAVLAPALLVIALGGAIGLFDGGFRETTWYPLGLFVLALLVLVLVVAPPGRGSRSRAFEVSAALFAGFTLWSYASILWADVPADAWTGANRTLLYLLVFLLAGLRPWPVASARLALALVGLGLAAIAVGVLIATGLDNDPSGWFLGGRLSDPTGYANATANFWLIGAFPALYLAVSSDTPLAVRGLGLAAATILLQVALLSQSRGAVAAAVLTAIAFVLLHPRHWSALAALAVPAVWIGLGWATLTDVREATSTAQLDAALADARTWIFIGAVVAFVVAVVAALAERRVIWRVGRSAQRRRASSIAFYALAGVLAVALCVVLATQRDWLDERWQDFKTTGYEQVDAQPGTRFGALGSARYDTWRVALLEFRDHPIAGIGAENYTVPYLQERRTPEAPRYAHSLVFSLLSSLGLIGTLLFTGFLIAAITGMARTRLRGSPGAREVSVAAFVGAFAWLSHASVDWLYEWPALAIPAIAMLAIAARTTDRSPSPARQSSTWLASLPVRLVVGILVLASAVSLTLLGAAARYERSAFEVQAKDREAAMTRLQRAADLDPFDADPLVAKALFSRQAGRLDDARSALAEAIEREPKNWFAHFEVALLEGEARRFAPAERALARAAELNPRQALIPIVRRDLRRRRPIDASDVEAQLGGQLSNRLSPLDAP